MNDLSDRINKTKRLIDESDYVLIGAGAGLSTAAGIDYGGERFQKYFADYIEQYNFTDMYTSSFYDFETEEEFWAYWARHIYVNNVGMGSTQLYEKLLKLVENKNYFVISTNVDDQFTKSGFESSRIFLIQGSYRFIQCKNACHDSLYDDSSMVKEMLKETTRDLKIPSNLIPSCPVCGGPMDVNLRKDDKFVQDEYWYKQHKAYVDFINKAKYDKTVLLEFGVGFNTPGIIRFPFESMTSKISKWNLVRFNKSHIELSLHIENQYTPFTEDIESIIDELLI